MPLHLTPLCWLSRRFLRLTGLFADFFDTVIAEARRFERFRSHRLNLRGLTNVLLVEVYTDFLFLKSELCIVVVLMVVKGHVHLSVLLPCNEGNCIALWAYLSKRRFPNPLSRFFNPRTLISWNGSRLEMFILLLSLQIRSSRLLIITALDIIIIWRHCGSNGCLSLESLPERRGSIFDFLWVFTLCNLFAG